MNEYKKSTNSNFKLHQFWRVASKFFHINKIYVKEFKQWKDAEEFMDGYEKDEIFEKILKSAISAKDNESYFERDSVILWKETVDWQLLAFLYLSAAKNKGELNVLDIGGSLGSTYFENLKELNYLKKVNWSIVEQDKLVNLGKKHLSSYGINFFSSVDEALEFRQYDVALFGSSLQYFFNYDLILNKIAKTRIQMLLIDRTPTFARVSHGIFLQRVPQHIYKAEYVSRVFSKSNLIKELSKNWDIVLFGKSGHSPAFTVNLEKVEWSRFFALKKKS